MNSAKFIKICLMLFFSFSISHPAFCDFKNNIPQNEIQNLKSETQEKGKIAQPPKTQIHSEKKTPSGEDLLGSTVTKHNSNAPVYFQGDWADGSHKKGILNLVGHVILSQDNMTLKADKAQLIQKKLKEKSDTTPNSNAIEQAIATGNVRIYKGSSALDPEIKASCDKVEFDVEQKILTLTGHSKVWRNTEYVHANAIEINLDSGDIHLSEPQGTIDPQSATKKKNL